MPIDSMAASTITATNAGTASASSWRIATLPARKIISVVTSPVISATPPELTEKTTKVANLMVFARSSCSERIRVMETSVAVMLSASDENTKQKVAVRNSKARSLIRLGNTR